MPFRLLAGHEKEFEVVDTPHGPTGAQQREVNRLQLQTTVLSRDAKTEICDRFGWYDDGEDGRDYSAYISGKYGHLTYLVKALQVICPGFDAPLNQQTKDNLLVGEAQDAISLFFRRCGGKSGEQAASLSSATALLRALNETESGASTADGSTSGTRS